MLNLTCMAIIMAIKTMGGMSFYDNTGKLK